MSVLLISGAIATGKTAVAEAVAARLHGEVLKVRLALGEVLGMDPTDRRTLQRRGADLDRRTSGRWLRDYILERHRPGLVTVVDSVRTELQTIPILDSLADSRLVYLEAHESTRRSRYGRAASTDSLKRSIDFDAAMHHPTEALVTRLRPMAHQVIATDDLDVETIASIVVELD
jgi:adenylosuccinate synthase